MMIMRVKIKIITMWLGSVTLEVLKGYDLTLSQNWQHTNVGADLKQMSYMLVTQTLPA